MILVRAAVRFFSAVLHGHLLGVRSPAIFHSLPIGMTEMEATRPNSFVGSDKKLAQVEPCASSVD